MALITRALGVSRRSNCPCSDEEIEFAFITSQGTDEIVTAISGGESTYREAGREPTEQREAAGRMKYRRLGADGTLVEDWQDAPPPPSRSARRHRRRGCTPDA